MPPQAPCASLFGQDSNRQAHLRALDSGFLLSATGRRSIRAWAASGLGLIWQDRIGPGRGFRANSPGSINASDDDGQLLSYSDPASPDSEGKMLWDFSDVLTAFCLTLRNHQKMRSQAASCQASRA